MVDELSPNKQSDAAQDLAPTAVRPESSVDKPEGKDKTKNPETDASASDSTARLPRLDRYWNLIKSPDFTNPAIAIATIVIALATVASWWEVHQGGKQTDKIVTASQNIQSALDTQNANSQVALEKTLGENREVLKRNLQQAGAAMDASNKQSATSLDATIKNFQQDERAWLGAGDETYSIVESGPISSTVTVLNTGKSPALDILCRITGTTKPKGVALQESDIVYLPNQVTVKQGTLFPNQHFPLSAGGQAMTAEAQKAWFANVQSGAWVQYFFGDVRYKDVFGKDHWAHFCTQFVSETKTGTPCPVYNDTDDKNQKYDDPK